MPLNRLESSLRSQLNSSTLTWKGLPVFGYRYLACLCACKRGDGSRSSTMAVTQAVSVVTGNQGARVFHLMMIIPAGILLLILSLTSLGTMATTNNKFKDVLDDLGKDGNCILFTKAKNNDFDPNKDSQCNFVVWGDAILAILAVMFSVVLGLKAALNVAV